MKIITDGGINENDGAQVNECQSGFNFDLVFGDTNLVRRAALDLKGTSTNGGNIRGIMQLIKRDDTETTLVFDDDGVAPEIFLWDGVAVFTSKRTANLAVGSKLRSEYWSLDDRIAIVDIAKLTPLLAWNGTDCTRHKTGLFDGSGVSVTGITQTAGIATATYLAVHGRTIGDLVKFFGAAEAGYNIEAEVLTTPTTTTLTYAVVAATASPATGTITADFGVELYAKYAVIHNGRQWLFNVTTNNGATTSDTPHLAVASFFENIESYDTTVRNKAGALTGNEAFFILSRDLKPINGVVLFNKELVISTVDGRLYRLVGNDATNYDWIEYYAGSSAVGTETLVNFGNDVALMRKGGRIDTLRATDASSDVTLDDISRWIPNITRNLQDAISVYDNDRQKVYFFVLNQVLVLYKENLFGSEFSPWSVFKTQLAFNFNTSAAVTIRRPGLTSYSVYLGGSTGEIYDLNGELDGDATTTNIITERVTPLIEELETKKGMINGRVQYRRIGLCDLNLSFNWSEEANTTNSIISLKGASSSDPVTPVFSGEVYFGGEFYFGQGFSGLNRRTSQNFSPSGRGPSFFLTTNVDSLFKFQIDEIILGI